MVTLITGGNNYGTHRCDARCYEATGLTCHCVCGGINHGQGVTKAMELTVHKAELEIERYCLAAGVSVNQGRETLMAKGYLQLELCVDLAGIGARGDQQAASGGDAGKPGLAPRQAPLTGQYEAELSEGIHG